MAKKTTPAKATEDNKYFEFNVHCGDYDLSGRLYTSLEKTVGKMTVTPLSITIDDLLSIKGCSFKQTEKNAWISFPEYKNKNGDYVSYVYVDKAQTAFEELATYLVKPF